MRPEKNMPAEVCTRTADLRRSWTNSSRRFSLLPEVLQETSKGLNRRLETSNDWQLVRFEVGDHSPQGVQQFPGTRYTKDARQIGFGNDLNHPQGPVRIPVMVRRRHRSLDCLAGDKNGWS